MGKTIKLTCEGCGKVHTLPKTKEIPQEVDNLFCNWCPVCEDDALEPYEEWYPESKKEEEKIIDPNQLSLF